VKNYIVSLTLLLILSVSNSFCASSSTSSTGIPNVRPVSKVFFIQTNDGIKTPVPREVVQKVDYFNQLVEEGYELLPVPFLNADQLKSFIEAVKEIGKEKRRGIFLALSSIGNKSHKALTDDQVISNLAAKLSQSPVTDEFAQAIEGFNVPILTQAFARRIVNLAGSEDSKDVFLKIVNVVAPWMKLSDEIDSEYRKQFGGKLVRDMDGTVEALPLTVASTASTSSSKKTINTLLGSNEEEGPSYLKRVYMRSIMPGDQMTLRVLRSQGIEALYSLNLSGLGLTDLDGINKIPDKDNIQVINLAGNPDLTISPDVLRSLQALRNLGYIYTTGTKINVTELQRALDASINVM